MIFWKRLKISVGIKQIKNSDNFPDFSFPEFLHENADGPHSALAKKMAEKLEKSTDHKPMTMTFKLYSG